MSYFILTEGAYTSYTLYDTITDLVNIASEGCFINCQETKILILTSGAWIGYHIRSYDIATKVLSAILKEGCLGFNYNLYHSDSFVSTFTVCQNAESGTRYLQIFKNGVVLQTIAFSTLGLSDSSPNYVSISPRGKYIVICGRDAITGDESTVVLVGS